MRVILDNPRNEKTYNEDIDNLAGINIIKNLILGPILHKNKLIGVLQLYNKVGPLTPLEKKILMCILDTLGIIFNTNLETSYGVKL